MLGLYYFAAQITAIVKPLNCLLTLLLLLAINDSNAEFTKGTTRIYFHPGSQVSAVLFDHVYIDCGAILPG
jgi:hypothetical protein